MSSLICVWTNDWANNRNAGDSSRNCAHYDVTVMKYYHCIVLIDYYIMQWSHSLFFSRIIVSRILRQIVHYVRAPAIIASPGKEAWILLNVSEISGQIHQARLSKSNYVFSKETHDKWQHYPRQNSTCLVCLPFLGFDFKSFWFIVAINH